MRFPNHYIIALSVIIMVLAIAVDRLYDGAFPDWLLLGGLTLNIFQLILIDRHFKKLALRFFPEKKENTTEAIQAITDLVELQHGQLKSMVTAIEKIQEGDLEKLTAFSLEGEAGNAVQNLQNKLRTMKEEGAKQNWTVKGIALMGEIRRGNSSLNDYAHQIISTLVRYLEANQGAIYMLAGENQEQHLELLATTYGKRKHTDDKILVDVDSGLLGQSVHEKDIIFLTQVPKDYVKIKSGLGEAIPRCIAIVPLLFRDQVYGVVEIASFEVFENHHLDFIRKVSEGIATELADLLRQEKTSRLLEQTQQQTLKLNAVQDEMKRKEKMLLQHMSNLSTSQDQMKSQEIELKQQLKQVLCERRKNQAILEGCVDGVICFDESGTVQFFNRAAEEIFGYKRSEIILCPITEILDLNIVGNHHEIENKDLITVRGNKIDVRTEVDVREKNGKKISIFLTLTKVKLESGILFTLFVQKNPVEFLFQS